MRDFQRPRYFNPYEAVGYGLIDTARRPPPPLAAAAPRSAPLSPACLCARPRPARCGAPLRARGPTIRPQGRRRRSPRILGKPVG